MNRALVLIIISILFLSYAHYLPSASAASSAPAIEWSKRYFGATAVDGWGYVVIQTSDGGYAVAGRTETFGAGSFDYWLIKTDVNGNMLWNKTYGGTNYEKVLNVIQTSDGGYAIVGDSWSFSGWYDGWLVKTDSSGNKQWSQVYGGADVDTLWSVVQTGDGGYALAGNTRSFGAGGYDYWLIRTDTLGNVQWQKTYGGSGDDVGRTVVQTGDGGYALSGATWSFGAGVTDFWLVKVNGSGNMQWNRTYGGAGLEDGGFMVVTGDGGYVLAGHTHSFGAGGDDYYLVKTDSNGNMQWDRTYGGSGTDWAGSVVQAGDGGFTLLGVTNSFGAGGNDFWLIRTDGNGNMQWNQTYGGTSNDVGTSVIETNDGGYALAGYTNSFSGNGSYEVYVVKLSSEETAYQNLLLQIAELRADLASISSQIGNLNISYNQLLQNYSELLTRFNILNSSIQQHLQGYNQLQANLNSLTAKLNDLNSTMSDYRSSTESQMAFATNIGYCLIAITVILFVATWYLATKKPKQNGSLNKNRDEPLSSG